MKAKSFIYALLMLLVSGSLRVKAQDQNVEFIPKNFPDQKEQLKEVLRQIKEGDGYYELGRRATYLLALDNYLKAFSFNPNNALLDYRIGNCFLYSIQKTNSIYYYEKAFRINPEVAPDILYQMAQAYHLNLDFDKAISKYKEYKYSLPSRDLEVMAPEIDKKIAECNVAKELVNNPVRVFIDNAGKNVNSVYPDYLPVISADEAIMMFTSCRPNTTGGGRDPDDMFFYEDIYITYNANGKWTEALNVGKPINTNFHDACIALSPDGQTLLTYRGDNGGDIYQSKLEGDSWSAPEKLGKSINSKYHESSASFSPDGNTIYFTSDRPGGTGGSDVYMSTRDKRGDWGEAVNLGPVINTPFDEEGAFMHPNGRTLYFSSKGHNTMGGFDIFFSVLDSGKWSQPVNLGYPINTPDDDVFFTISANLKHGYFSSVRPEGSGEKDIYIITFLGPEKPMIDNTEDNLLAALAAPVREKVVEPKVKITPNQLTIVKGVISDEESKIPLKAFIEITDNEKNTVISTFESNSKTGKYLVSLPSGTNYGIAVKADGYLFHSENFDIPGTTEYREIVKDIAMKKIEVGKKIVLNNIFFDFDKATLRPESTRELDNLTKLMTDMPTLKIEISGHTDNIGTAAYNYKLSEMRAQAVVNYLTGKGIDISRLTFKGYGFDQPVATNDTPEGRQLNRRTEFKITEK